MRYSCLIIIVTYNSEKYIQWAISGLESSESAITIKIVDSGSKSKDYLNELVTKHKLILDFYDNIGFVAANNNALNNIDSFDWILFLNPDARIEGKDLDSLISSVSNDGSNDIGICSVPLIRFNIDNKTPLHTYDSLGIACSPIGRWYDVGNNQPVVKAVASEDGIEAVCGAFMLIRRSALQSCPDKMGRIGFESSYYMYKEDIELSLRMKKKGWKVQVINDVTAYHCRGWSNNRHQVPYWARLHSARNDIDLAKRYRFRALPFAVIKYIWVRFFESK